MIGRPRELGTEKCFEGIARLLNARERLAGFGWEPGDLHRHIHGGGFRIASEYKVEIVVVFPTRRVKKRSHANVAILFLYPSLRRVLLDWWLVFDHRFV